MKKSFYLMKCCVMIFIKCMNEEKTSFLLLNESFLFLVLSLLARLSCLYPFFYYLYSYNYWRAMRYQRDNWYINRKVKITSIFYSSLSMIYRSKEVAQFLLWSDQFAQVFFLGVMVEFLVNLVHQVVLLFLLILIELYEELFQWHFPLLVVGYQQFGQHSSAERELTY